MPSIGRFINKDPIGLAGGLNMYGYVGGNPINLVDPMGLVPGSIDWGRNIQRFHRAIGLDIRGKSFNSMLFWAGYANSLIVNANSIVVVATVFIIAPNPVSIIAGIILVSGSSGLAIQAYRDAWTENGQQDHGSYIKDAGCYYRGLQ
jgi:uncharacterized protein RhaS with RHS repeats